MNNNEFDWTVILPEAEERRRHWGGCRMFLKLTHSHGPAVRLEWRACKYFEATK